MTYERLYGKAEGLADRLDAWAQRVSMDKTLPWIGLGIIADIRAAAATIRGEPLPDPDLEKYTDVAIQSDSLEYDL
jgi:hypothetical protein